MMKNFFSFLLVIFFFYLIEGCWNVSYSMKMYDAEDCPGSPNAYLSVNMATILSTAYSDSKSFSYDSSTNCFTVERDSTTVSTKWSCGTSGSSLKYDIYSSSDCSGTTSVDVDLSSLYKESCINACGVSTKFKCGSTVVGDDYVHLSVYSSTVDSCTGKPEDVAMDIYYKLQKCNTLRVGSFMFSFMIGSPDGEKLYYAFYTGGECKTILAVNKWTTPATCLDVGVRRSIPSLVIQYKGFGENDSSTTTTIGSPNYSDDFPPSIDDLFGGGEKLTTGCFVMVLFFIVFFFLF